MQEKTIGEHFKSFASYAAPAAAISFNIMVIVGETFPNMSLNLFGAIGALLTLFINGLLVIIAKKWNGKSHEVKAEVLEGEVSREV